MKDLTEAQAYAIAREGAAIRRAADRHWFLWTENQLVVWVPPTANSPAVEQVATAADFALDEWLANDWTDEPWTLSPEEGGGDGPRPPGANPPIADSGGSGAGGSGSGAGGSGGAGAGGGSGSGSASPQGSGSNPPGGQGGDKAKPLSPRPKLTPSVTLAFLASPIEHFELDRNVTIDHDDGDSCFIRNPAYVSDVARANLYLTASVAGLAAHGSDSVGVLSVRIAGRPDDEGTVNVGNGQRTIIFSNFTFVPGGTITATASLRVGGRTYLAAPATKTFDPWCAAVPTDPPSIVVTFTGITENDPSNYITGADPNGPHTVPWFAPGSWSGTFSGGAFNPPGDFDDVPVIQWYINVSKDGDDNYDVTMYPDIGSGRGGFFTTTPAALGAAIANTYGGGSYYFDGGTAVVSLPA